MHPAPSVGTSVGTEGFAMGMLTAIQIRNFKEPGRYSDGQGLILKLVSPGRSSWIVRVQASGKRRDIGLVA